jgi:protein-disulfide isomerase
MQTCFPSSRLARTLAAAVLLIVPLAAGPSIAAQSTPTQSTPSQFSPAQRAEIVQILRDALKQDPTILRDAVDSMKQDDAQRDADASRAAILAHRDAMVTPDDPVAGNKNGTATIIEFYDTRCPYCRQMEPTMTRLLRQNPDVRLVYKDLPILGPPSVIAAHALLAAQKQGGYEKLRTALMNLPPDYTKDEVLATARKLGLDDVRLAKDMDDPAIAARLDANLQLARALGIDGTPALIIGDTLIPGAVEMAELEKDIAAARSTQ